MKRSRFDWKPIVIGLIIGVLSVILKMSYLVTFIILIVAGIIYLIFHKEQKE